MFKNLKGKWVLITGGAQRVGAVIAWFLALLGMKVIIHFNTSAGPALKLERRIKKLGGRVELVQGDLTKPGVVEAIFAELNRKKMMPYAVLCNAAVFEPNDTQGKNKATNKNAVLQIWRVWTRYVLAAREKGSFIVYADAWLLRGRRYQKELKLEEYMESKLWIPEWVRKAAEFGKKGIQVVAIGNGATLPRKKASKKSIAIIAGQLYSTKDEQVPWIGPNAVALATVLVLANRAIHACCIPVDAGRGAIGKLKVPKEH